ncbi:MAG: hypothetical protein IPG38_06575 [Chitinophagaceae bacterium]|nr:hypothetical protein [Chitinophagaceae bacterium]
MMKNLIGLFLMSALGFGYFSAHAQKNIAEATFVYNIKGQGLNGASTTVYIKGNNSRNEMVSVLGKALTIFNSKLNRAVILKGIQRPEINDHPYQRKLEVQRQNVQ